MDEHDVPVPFGSDFIAAARFREAPAAERTSTARRIAAAHAVAQPWRAAPSDRPARRRSGSHALTFTAVLGLVGVAIAGPGPLPGVGLGRTGSPAATTHLPPVPSDAGAVPLGRPAAAPAGSGGYTVRVTGRGGSPVRYDPCRPVHWVMRPDGAPTGGQQLVAAQFALVGRLTGLRFVYDGETDEAPREDRSTYQPVRYGDRWAPALVAWTDVQEYPPLRGYAGLGGAAPVEDGGPQLAGGVVLLDRRGLTGAQGRPAAGADLVVLHEIGHLVGLGHVADPREVMSPGGPARTLGAGDLRGLHAMGSGPCSRRDPHLP